MNGIPPENSISYTLSAKVQPADIDDLKHVNNLVYLKWALDISGKHWKILSNPEIDKKYAWVVLRHEIDYLKPAYENEEIKIVTWIGETSGIKSIRHVVITRNDAILAKVKTTWCLIDLKTGKPVRIGKEILELLEKRK